MEVPQAAVAWTVNIGGIGHMGSIVVVSEYACRLRLIVSQTQVDFKAGEYVDPAYIAYIQE